MSDPQAAAIVSLYRQALTLKRLPRTGWLQRGVAPVESIAEHIFGVATLALLVADSYPALDRGRLLAIALLHDMAEVALSDLPASATRLLGAATKHDAERRALAQLCAALPGQAAHLALWDDYAAGASPEARLVKGLDRLELLAQALAYEQAGSRGLDEFWQGAACDWPEEFPVLRQMALALLAQRPEARLP